VCAAARRFGVLLLVDVVGKVDRAEVLATQYPDVTFVLPHLGGFADDWFVQRRCVDLIRRLPNVYADTSGVRYFDVLLHAARIAPHKLVLGTDGPFLHPGVELFKVRQLGLPPALEAQVIGGTALRLLGVDRPLAPRTPGPDRAAWMPRAPAPSYTAAHRVVPTTSRFGAEPW
jgi:hypothetical protein